MPSLGILVKSAEHPRYVTELARAARAKGKQVCIHFAGPGVLLLNDSEVADLAQSARVSVCEASIRRHPLPADLAKCFQDHLRPAAEIATLIKSCDRWVVF